MLLEFRA